MSYSYYKIGENRNRKRIFLEANLEAAGFNCGDPYKRVNDIEGGTITLYRLEESESLPSDRRVTKGKRKGKDRPIIDLCDKIIEAVFKDTERVRVSFLRHQIIIEVHPEEFNKSKREESFKRNMKTGELTHASLFTGGGISTDAIHCALDDDGLIAEGAKWVCEADWKYIEEAKQHCLAVTDETVIINGMVEEVESNLFTSVNILSLSMECSGFSKAGKAYHKQSAEEHSGTALFGVVNAVRNANPAIVISENVIEAKNSSMFALFTGELNRLGYKIFELELSNQHTGSIEKRRRYWMVAISENIAPESIELPLVEQNQNPLNSFLQEVEESVWGENQYLKDKAIRDAAAGKGFAKRQLLSGDETNVGTIGRHYAKRRSTEPFIVRADGKERLLTPIEHAIVKSIPTRLVPEGGITLAHQILGQSVDYLQPYKLMKAIIGRLSPLGHMR